MGRAASCLALLLLCCSGAWAQSSAPPPPEADPAGRPARPAIPASPAADSGTVHPDTARGETPRPAAEGVPAARNLPPLRPSGLPPRPGAGVSHPSGGEGPPLRQWLLLSRNLAEAEQQRKRLEGHGLKVISRRQLTQLGRVLSVFRLPPGVDAEPLMRTLQQAHPDWLQEPNQRYRPLGEEDDARQWGQRAVGWQAGLAGCSQTVVLGMLDTPVNAALPVFEGAKLTQSSVVPAQLRARDEQAARHGSGVAALLVGRGDVGGLLPQAQLHAVAVFGQDETGLHTRSDWLLAALDQLAGQRPPVAVVNLSFGGDRSQLLEVVFAQLGRQMRFVAAAGNEPGAGVAYPAAYAGVLAVGSVDARLQPSRRNSSGAGLDLVAPGEDVWTVDEHGQGYYASGSSFAAPFATAAMALNPQVTLRDLGPPGRDAVFGDGLVQMPGCPTGAP